MREVDYSVGDGVGVITLNRPEKLNALNATMEEELYASMREASGDERVRVIVLTGAGRGFCSGADLGELAELGAGSSESRMELYEQPEDRRIDRDLPEDFGLRLSYFPAVPKPVIGAINGVAAGVGTVIALYCDLRLWSDSARMTTAFAARGLAAEQGVSWVLERQIGIARAADLLLSARFVEAEEAYQLGLANAVYPAASFEEDAARYARDLAAAVSPRSLRVIKRQLWTDLFTSLGDSVARGDREMLACFESDDFKEALAALGEKRPPRFTGH